MEFFGGVVLEFVGFVGGEGEGGSGWEGVGLAVDDGGEGALGDEEDFPHVVVRMSGCDVTGLEDGAGELGDLGDFAVGEEDLFLDGRVVGDFAPGGVGWGDLHGDSGGRVGEVSSTGRVVSIGAGGAVLGCSNSGMTPVLTSQKRRAATRARMRTRRSALRLGKGRFSRFLLGSGR